MNSDDIGITSLSVSRTILLTGAAGFIGSHVAESLVHRGDEVIAVDNFNPFYDPMCKRRNLDRLVGEPNFKLIEGDIRNEEVLRRAFAYAPFAAVVHLAAMAGVRPSLVDPLLYQSVNVLGTTSLLEHARRTTCGHLVLASSSSVYGDSGSIPFRETDAADRPSSPYASTKRAMELAAHVYYHIYGLDITCLRFFTVYGPRQRPEMAIHKFTRLIDSGDVIDLYGDGTSARDYTYIDDILDGVLRAIDRPNGFRVYNLGGTATTALVDLAEMLAERLERPLHVRYLPTQAGDVPITYADVSLATKELGYVPRTPISRGLDLFVNWYRQSANTVQMAAGS
jgi:UDP-glucuronate 4-epimerase